MALRPNIRPVPVVKLNPAILVMQSAQDWTTKNVPGAIDGARDRRIFLQGGRGPHGRANGIRKRNGFVKDCRQAELGHLLVSDVACRFHDGSSRHVVNQVEPRVIRWLSR
jgi:hypothetical protein